MGPTPQKICVSFPEKECEKKDPHKLLQMDVWGQERAILGHKKISFLCIPALIRSRHLQAFSRFRASLQQGLATTVAQSGLYKPTSASRVSLQNRVLRKEEESHRCCAPAASLSLRTKAISVWGRILGSQHSSLNVNGTWEETPQLAQSNVTAPKTWACTPYFEFLDLWGGTAELFWNRQEHQALEEGAWPKIGWHWSNTFHTFSSCNRAKSTVPESPHHTTKPLMGTDLQGQTTSRENLQLPALARICSFQRLTSK